MIINENVYPLVSAIGTTEYTNVITDCIEQTEYAEKSIFYAGCNNKYLNRLSPYDINYYNGGFGFNVEFKNVTNYTKSDLMLSTNDYGGGLFNSHLDVLEKGWHGENNTLIRKFDFTTAYIDLSNIFFECLNTDNAHRTDTTIAENIVTYSLDEYIGNNIKYPILNVIGLRSVINTTGHFNVLNSIQSDKVDVYSSFAFNANGSYETPYNSSAIASGTCFYGKEINWNNSGYNNSNILYNDTLGYVPVARAYTTLYGTPSPCIIDIFSNSGEQIGNYFIPTDYDFTDSPIPIVYYGTEWVLNLTFGYSLDYFLHIIASLGLRFKYNNEMYVSEIDKLGYTTGRYIKADELATSDFNNKNWTNSTDSNYDSDIKPDGEIENQLENIGLNENTSNSRFVRWYIMTPDQMSNFQDWLDSDERPVGFDSMKNIISVSEFMLDLSKISLPFGVPTIKIGTELYGAPFGDSVAMLLANVKRTVNIGSINITRYNNDFTDFAPYSTYDLYIPYCGWMSLDSDIIVGNTIDVYLIGDPITSGCKGVAMCNGNIVGEINGTFGNTIPISSNNIGQYKQALLNNALSIGSGVLGTATSVATGNAIGIASGALSLISGVSQSVALKHTSFTESKGNTTTATMYNTYDRCVLVETHPIERISSNYAHTIGYVTNKSKELSSCSGFVKCENVDTSGLTCDYAEREEIKAILEKGFYC